MNTAVSTPAPPSRIALPPPPSVDTIRSSALTLSPSPSTPVGSVPLPKDRRRSTRTSIRRPSRPFDDSRRASRAFDGNAEDEQPKLPTLVPGIRPAYSTPLPVLPMVVLCIAMMSELLSANLSQPFLLKMVEGKPKEETEAAVGFWTVFYITQFLTSLLWSSIADRHGRRAVLVASMTGSAIGKKMEKAMLTTNSFGRFWYFIIKAICVRLCQGIFGGAIGVFRGSIRDLTDETNATRAYAVLGFSWGMGGVLGPILGGVFESPAINFKGTFLGEIEMFRQVPFLLPTMMGSSILIMGAVMACFLSWDGGVRGGSRIALDIVKDEPLAPEPMSPDTPVLSAASAPVEGPSRTGYFPPNDVSVNPLTQRRDSRGSLGTAYGYGGIRSKHPTLAARAALEAARRVSSVAGPPLDHHERAESFATKLLMANEENSFNINDLWVSAAVAQDIDVFEEDDDEEGSNQVTPQPSPSRYPIGRRTTSGADAFRFAHRPSISASRRFSTSSGAMPAIFSNTGLASPAYEIPPDENQNTVLSAIAETPVNESTPLTTTESSWKLLPLMMIFQYGLLSFHDTTHGQLFLSFLITPYRSGGVGLTPAHFSFLVAVMCCFQLFYQFFLYPRLGPPLGRFNHLQMFRLGSVLFMPAYLLLPLLHTVASPDKEGGVLVMISPFSQSNFLQFRAIRYCGGTLGYTSVMILVNAMSPPHVVGLANGLAQSIVSCARFFGPAIGGTIWSASISGNSSGYAVPFYIVATVALIQFLTSFFIR